MSKNIKKNNSNTGVNLVEKLLSLDIAKISELPTATIKIDRLSELLGEDFTVTCRAIKSDTHSEIQKRAVDFTKKGDIKDMNPHDMRVLTVIEGVVNPNLKDEQLKNYFGAATPKILVEKLFLAGEIVDIYNLINELSGFEGEDEDTSSEIKNL